MLLLLLFLLLPYCYLLTITHNRKLFYCHYTGKSVFAGIPSLELVDEVRTKSLHPNMMPDNTTEMTVLLLSHIEVEQSTDDYG